MLAGHGKTLMRLIAETAPGLVRRFKACIDQDGAGRPCLDRLYSTFDSIDFSREVLEPRPDRLLVKRVATDCGWSDLGTPERLESYLAAHPSPTAPHRERTLPQAISGAPM